LGVFRGLKLPEKIQEQTNVNLLLIQGKQEGKKKKWLNKVFSKIIYSYINAKKNYSFKTFH
jgi:hypothetical protein